MVNNSNTTNTKFLRIFRGYKVLVHLGLSRQNVCFFVCCFGELLARDFPVSGGFSGMNRSLRV